MHDHLEKAGLTEEWVKRLKEEPYRLQAKWYGADRNDVWADVVVETKGLTTIEDNMKIGYVARDHEESIWEFYTLGDRCIGKGLTIADAIEDYFHWLWGWKTEVPNILNDPSIIE